MFEFIKKNINIFGSKENFFRNEMQKIAETLKNLESGLDEVSKSENYIEGIVKLFQVISPIQDKGLIAQALENFRNKKYEEFSTVINALENLNRSLVNAGRNSYGMNRTKAGETVTLDNVFLGDVYGMWTKTAAYWLANKTDLEKATRPDISRDPYQPVSDWYIINNYQCESFIKDHAKNILEQIMLLESYYSVAQTA